MNKYSKLFLFSLVVAQLSAEQILIKGGTIFDGKNEAFIADILIERMEKLQKFLQIFLRELMRQLTLPIE